MPVRLKPVLKEPDVLPIVAQYIAKPTPELLALALKIANREGRLGILVETLKVASRIAKKLSLSEKHVHEAHEFRQKMTGGAE